MRSLNGGTSRKGAKAQSVCLLVFVAAMVSLAGRRRPLGNNWPCCGRCRPICCVTPAGRGRTPMAWPATIRRASRARSSSAGPCTIWSGPSCDATSDALPKAGPRSTPRSAIKPSRAVSAGKALRTAALRPWPSGWPNSIRPFWCCAKASSGRSTRSESSGSCRRFTRPPAGLPSHAIKRV